MLWQSDTARVMIAAFWRRVAYGQISIHAMSLDHSEHLAALYRDDRAFLKLWDPQRPDAFYTQLGQAEAVKSTLRECGEGRMWAGVVLAGDVLVGRVNLNGILRGPLRSCFLGYWIAQPHSGRGIAIRR